MTVAPSVLPRTARSAEATCSNGVLILCPTESGLRKLPVARTARSTSRRSPVPRGLAGLFQAATTLSIIACVGFSSTKRCRSVLAMKRGVEGWATIASSARSASLIPFAGFEEVSGMIA